MTDTLQKLRSRMERDVSGLSLLNELEKEQAGLLGRINELEELLIMIVRTGWPWDEDGEPNEIHRSSREGFSAAMAQARDLLGLDIRSRITRTEPRT